MTAPDQTNAEVSDERLREIINGCEGVQGGPWEVVASTRGDWPSLYVRAPSDGIVAQIMQGVVEDRFRLNAAHIARLDPETNRYLATAELNRRSVTSQASEGEVARLREELNREQLAHDKTKCELRDAYDILATKASP